MAFDDGSLLKQRKIKLVFLFMAAVAIVFFADGGVKAAPDVSVPKQDVLTLRDGTTLNVNFRCPDERSGKRWPAILLFGGFETGAGAIELVSSRSAFCLITFEYPFEGPRKFQFPRDLKLLPRAKVAMHETLEGIGRLLDWVATRQEMDRKKIVLVGASFGAPFASIVAGERKDVAALILVHGFGDVAKVISYRIASSWGVRYGPAGRFLAFLVGKFLWWYADMPSPEERLMQLSSHQRVLMLTAKADDLLPPEAVESMRSSVQRSSAIWQEKKLPGAHLRPEETKLIELLLGEATSWLKEQGILGQ